MDPIDHLGPNFPQSILNFWYRANRISHLSRTSTGIGKKLPEPRGSNRFMGTSLGACHKGLLFRTSPELTFVSLSAPYKLRERKTSKNVKINWQSFKINISAKQNLATMLLLLTQPNNFFGRSLDFSRFSCSAMVSGSGTQILSQILSFI